MTFVGGFAEPLLGGGVVCTEIHHTCLIHRLHMPCLGGFEEMGGGCLTAIIVIVAVAVQQAELVTGFQTSLVGSLREVGLGLVVVWLCTGC